VNILLTGASGQLGQELVPQLRQLGDLTLVDRQALPAGHQILQRDLSDLNQLEILLNRTTPDLIVNAAAYTAVDQAEEDTVSAFQVNAELPGCLARWASRNNRLLVHYSTDYVFSGDAGKPYAEQDPTGPLGVYGESKLAGEWAITASACRHIILRTSWVYSAHGNNFVLTMLRLARERPSLSIVSDQTGCPTWARNLARVTREVLGQLLSDEPGGKRQGIFHYCDAGAVTWYDFAHAIFSCAVKAGLLQSLPDMTGVPTAAFPQKAERPMYSVLDTSAIQRVFGIRPAGLDESLESCIEEIELND
jgi:dTDP-4-dehydrorhamnose reductase